VSIDDLRAFTVWPGVRRGEPRERLSPALTPGQRRRRRRLDLGYGQVQQFIDLAYSSGHASGKTPLVVRHQAPQVQHPASSCLLLLIGSKP
jgi:hypothetical protein